MGWSGARLLPFSTSPVRASLLGLALVVALACQPPKVMPASAEVSASPSALAFGRVAVGVSLPLVVELTNGGRAASNPIALSVEGPFLLSTTELIVAAGTTEQVTVSFVPVAPGAVIGTLRLSEGLGELQLMGEGLPACQSPEPCHAPRFELTTRECVTDPKEEGATCVAPCLAGEGTCRGGYCTAAALSSCVDGDACTLDACTSSGDCRNPPISCPVTDPCQATYCDPVSGCGTTPVTDGVPCGEATCEAAFICLGGRCQERARPNALSNCRYTALAAGADHTCVVTVGQALKCWGANDEDQQGRGFPSLLAVPGLGEQIASGWPNRSPPRAAWPRRWATAPGQRSRRVRWCSSTMEEGCP
jgi:hypothetical protein